jgi:hypothetical protein
MHLTVEQLALYLDALVLEKQDQIPEGIKEHMAKCYECKVEIVEVLELVEAIRVYSDETFPTFDYPCN